MRSILSNNQIALLAVFLMAIILGINWVALDAVRDEAISGEAVSSGRVSLCNNRPPEVVFDCSSTIMQGERYHCDVNLRDYECRESCLSINTSDATSGSDVAGILVKNTCSQELNMTSIEAHWSGEEALTGISADGTAIWSGSSNGGELNITNHSFGQAELRFSFDAADEDRLLSARLQFSDGARVLNLTFTNGTLEREVQHQICDPAYRFAGTAEPPLDEHFEIDSATGEIDFTVPITYDDTYTANNPYTIRITGDDMMGCTTSKETVHKDVEVLIQNHPPRITESLPSAQTVKLNETDNQSFFARFEDYDNENEDPSDDDNHTITWALDGRTVKETEVINYSPRTDTYEYRTDYLSSGNHSVRVQVSDGHLEGGESWSVPVNNVNRPPRFIKSVPNQTWTKNQVQAGPKLMDYVSDPDSDDELGFEVIYGSPFPAIEVTLDAANSYQALFAPPRGWIGRETVRFNVTDGRGGSDVSNEVQLTVEDLEVKEESASSGGGGSSSDPSGGSTEQRPCQPEWFCSDWSKCYENGTRYRVCYDLAECGMPETKPPEQESCEYVPQCNNGRQDQTEEGVDCGGPCPPCATCYDRIQNQGEEGVDCGGPCPPCPSCSDGIQNQGEEGVDCGGPCDQACPAFEEPAMQVQGGLKERLLSLSTLLIVLAAFGVVFGLTLVEPSLVRLYAAALHPVKKKRQLKEIGLHQEQQRRAAAERFYAHQEEAENLSGRERLQRLSRELRVSLAMIQHLPEASTFGEIEEACRKAGVSTSVQRRLTQFVSDVEELSYSGQEVSEERLRHLEDEARLLLREVDRESHVTVEGKDTRSVVREIRGLVRQANGALGRNDVEQAKWLYEQAKYMYEECGEAVQARVFKHLDRLYTKITELEQ